MDKKKYRKEYEKKNKEKLKDYRKKYYKKNKKKIKKYMKEYYKKKYRKNKFVLKILNIFEKFQKNIIKIVTNIKEFIKNKKV